jgi:HEAT repeat protein
MTFPHKPIRIAFLFAVLIVCLYFLYTKHTRKASAPDVRDKGLPGIDISALTPAAIPRHLEGLKSPDVAVRQKAAEALWQMGSAARKTTGALLEAAKDPDPRVREMATRALGTTSAGALDTVPGLLAALKDQAAGVRAAAAGALTQIWLDSKGRPWRARERDEGEPREHASREKSSLPLLCRTAAAERELREHAQEKTAPTKAERRKGEPEREPVRTAMPAPKLSAAAIEAMRAAVPALSAALSDPDPSVRANAAACLAETGERATPAVAQLAAMLSRDSNGKCRVQAALALGEIGPAAKTAVPLLVERLGKDEQELVRTCSAAALGKIHSDPEVAIPALMDAFLRELHTDTQAVMMMSLAQFGPQAKRAVPILQAAAKDPQNQNNPTRMEPIQRALDSIEVNLKRLESQPPGRK